MKSSITLVFTFLMVISCDFKETTYPSHEDLFKLYTTNCARVIAYEKAFCLEDIDYDAFYNPDAMIMGTSFNSSDTVGLDFFRFNVRNYPTSYNVYDSLGEAEYRLGNMDVAIRSFRQSLELNSENENAIRMLQKINTEREKSVD
ncbi:MAG: tetratricopeptide repeat protein [Saprospiraceae bacterium]|nr:tetratricopeptide repeat protein [Saprospiraceae bacterium]